MTTVRRDRVRNAEYARRHGRRGAAHVWWRRKTAVATPLVVLVATLVFVGLGCTPPEYRVVTTPLEGAGSPEARATGEQCERFASHLRALTFQEIRRRADRVQEDPPTDTWAMEQADDSYEFSKRGCLERGTVGEVRCAVEALTLAELSERCEGV